MKTAYPFPHERLLAPIEETRLEWKGENTPFQARHDDVYFALDSGFAETEAIFLQGNDLPERFERWNERTKPFVVGELGFGTGLNFLLTAEEFLKRNSCSRLYFISTEKYPIHRDDHREFFKKGDFIERFSLAEPLLAQLPGAVPGFHLLSFLDSRVQLLLLMGDANDTLDQLEAKVDAWYLDGFTPAKNPDLWSDGIFRSIARLSHGSTTASSYTAAGWVRRALTTAGFSVEKHPGFGKKRESIRARYQGSVEPLYQRTRPWFRMQAEAPRGQFSISGAGIAGMELASRLIRGGAQVEIHDPAFEFAASKNPQALVMPQFARAYTPLQHLTAQAFEKWNRYRRAESSIPGFAPTGVIRLPEGADDLADLKRAMEWLPIDRASWRWLESNETSTRTEGFFGGESLWLENAFTLRFPEYLAGLRESMGPRLRWLEKPSERPDILAEGSRIQEHPFLSGNLSPMRGQIAHVPFSGFKSPHAVTRDGYLIADPTRECLLIGGTYERGERELKLDPSYRGELWKKWPEFASQLPESDDPSVEGWMGFRAISRDHVPICGALPDPQFFEANYSELWRGRRETEYPDARSDHPTYVALGLGSKGALFSKLLADTLGGLLLGEPLSIEWSQWLKMNPVRFWVREHSTRKG